MSRNLQQGIQAIQSGNLTEGARLLRIALKDEQLPGNLIAVACLWMAETQPDPQFKIECYRRGLQADPNNADVSQRLSYWLSRQLPGQAGNSQPVLPVNPDQSVSQDTGQSMPPATPAQYQQQGTTGSMPPVNPAQQPPQGGSQPMSPVNPGQYGQQQGSSQPMPPVNPAQQQPQGGSQPMPPVNPAQYGQQQGGSQPMPPVNPGQYQQQNTTGSMPPVNPAPAQPQPQQQQAGYGNEPAIYLEQIQRSVGILDGPNGRGTGIFVGRDGLIATTRYVVGGESHVSVELLDRRVVPGQVVRSFPAMDLALVKINAQVAQLLSLIQTPELADNAPIAAYPHVGTAVKTTKRATRHQTPPQWFPTMTNHTNDAGGDPVFDEHNYLVGILTKNSRRSNGFLYGIFAYWIFQAVEMYRQERQQLAGNTAYCGACGVLSRAPSAGGYYCENCGNTLPYAIEIDRFPQPSLVYLYGEDAHHPCPNCDAQAGFHNGVCMRCGHEL